jgi:hypothetical protein
MFGRGEPHRLALALAAPPQRGRIRHFSRAAGRGEARAEGGLKIPGEQSRSDENPRVKDVPTGTAGSRNVPLFSAVACHDGNGQHPQEFPSKNPGGRDRD